MILHSPLHRTARGAIALAVIGALACSTRGGAGTAAAASAPETQEVIPMSSLKLTSSAFQHHGEIPLKYTCEGSDTSPPLAWSGAPPGTKSFALVIDDPDAPDPAAPKRTWVHWVLLDIPPSASELPEDASRSGLPAGTHTGKNDWGKTSYGGPCPPIGRHRYFHKLYALDAVLRLAAPSKAELEGAMRGHVLGETQLVGTYQKKGG